MIRKGFKVRILNLFLPQQDGSVPFSGYVTRIAASSFFKPVFGVWLIAVFLLVQRFGSPHIAYTAQEAILPPPIPQIHTDTNFQYPLIGALSQRFHWYHPGIDIMSPLGSNIQPIDDGIVIEVEYGKWGYGHKVVVEHTSGFKSLYAHLGQIYVSLGDKVQRNTPLATVGMTGWTTGPHLHLEILLNNAAIDPLTVLPEIVE